MSIRGSVTRHAFELINMTLYSTISRKNFKNVNTFIGEADSRAQVAALEDNVKEFGLTYFGMSDKRQGMRSMTIRCIIIS